MCLVLFVLISKQKLQICIIAIILVWSSMTYWRMTVHDVSSVIVTLQETQRGASDTSNTITVLCNISVLLSSFDQVCVLLWWWVILTQTLADQRCPVVKTAINENNWLWRQIIPGMVGDTQNITDVHLTLSSSALS